MAKPNMRLVPIADLTADPANLRLHGERSIEAIKASLRRFGQQKPIVVDPAGVVVAGNGMLEAARQLGWPSALVIQSGLAGVERVAYAIADNRSAELSEWDKTALHRTVRELDAEMMEATGWTLEELEQLTPQEEPAIEEDEGPPAPAKVAVSRPGDLWELGPHRLLCGDSTDPKHVLRVMGGERAALVATDPPYLVDYTGSRPEKAGRDSGKDWSDVYHEIDIKDADTFFRRLFENVLAVLAPNAAIYTWHAHRRCGLIQRIWDELGILDHQQIVWVKPSTVFGRVFWHFQHEPCMMGWRKGSMPAHDNSHENSSVWTLDWEGKGRVVGNEHPTQKPLEIFARPMRKHTSEGDLVFEPFSGSGSQLIAAEQLKRRCRAIEIEPVFVDVGIRRWQQLTGAEARLAGDGRTWSEVAEARGVPCPSAPSDAATSQAAQDSPQEPTAKSTSESEPRRQRGGTSKGRRRAAATEPTGDA